MWEFDCCRCQKTHAESEPLYAEHVMYQSKHGARFVTAEAAVVRAALLAGMSCGKPAHEETRA